MGREDVWLLRLLGSGDWGGGMRGGSSEAGLIQENK